MRSSRIQVWVAVLLVASFGLGTARVSAQGTPAPAGDTPVGGTPAENPPADGAPAGEAAPVAEDVDDGAVGEGAVGEGAVGEGAVGEGAVGPSDEATEAAREAYARGTERFAAGDYEGAKRAFEAAHAAVPNPIVLLPIAESALKLGRVTEAIEALERYLTERPDAPDRATVEARLQTLRATPALLDVSSTTPGVVITVDGRPLSGPLPQAVEVRPGPHTLEATAEGYAPQRESLEAEAGVRHTWDVRLEPLPPPTVAATDAEAPPPPTDSTAALWVTGIVGATGLLAGSVLGFMALAENSDYDADPTADSADRGERLALFADVAFGIGAMALVTGAVLYLTEGEAAASPEEARRAPLRVSGGASPDGAFVSTTFHY